MPNRIFSPELLAHATPTELAAIEQQLRLEAALLSPADYAEHCWSGFVRPRHIELLNASIVRGTEGKLLRADGTPMRGMIVTMPPRHGKSELISKFTPAWFLMRNPDKRVIVTSYSDTFAETWGAASRAIVQDHPEFGLLLDPSTQSKSHWRIDKHSGSMRTAGAGGPITGTGAHLMIIDDPFKDNEDADSQFNRDKVWDWFQSVVLSRLELPIWVPCATHAALQFSLAKEDCPDCKTPYDPPLMILVQTRWHEDDLAGRLIESEPEKWFQFDLPALAVEGDPLGRPLGAALWPEKYDKAYLEDLRTSLSARWWSAMYQQSPSIEGGGIFRGDSFVRYNVRQSDRGKLFTFMPKSPAPKRQAADAKMWKFATVDLAASTKTSADYTVAMVFAVSKTKDMAVLDVQRERMEGADHERFIERLRQKHPDLRFIGIEKATFGLTLIQTLRRKGVPVRELLPDKDKVSRAYGAAAFIEGEKLFFPQSAPWLADFEHELLAFDNGAHDDMVDCLAYGARVLSDHEKAPQGKPKNTYMDRDARIWARLDRKPKKKAQHDVLGSW
jgi:predicted phage terminase large subunit-like protein